MRHTDIWLAVVGPALIAISSGCSDSNSPAATNDDDTTTVHELAGTSWQLVEIQSMDDTSHVPEDRSLYTLEFGADGDASMRLDCNRGMGSWTSEGPGQLQFGVIAGTRAMCPPGSLHDQYLNQFEWVRSYVFNDGHLFLATMADGSIIEFEPVE